MARKPKVDLFEQAKIWYQKKVNLAKDPESEQEENKAMKYNIATKGKHIPNKPGADDLNNRGFSYGN